MDMPSSRSRARTAVTVMNKRAEKSLPERDRRIEGRQAGNGKLKNGRLRCGLACRA